MVIVSDCGGVRQGCILIVTRPIFIVHGNIMCHIKDQDGFRVGGVNINNLRYVHDTTLIADEEQKLQKLTVSRRKK